MDTPNPNSVGVYGKVQEYSRRFPNIRQLPYIYHRSAPSAHSPGALQKYIAATNWFMEDLLRENQVPFQWCGKYKVVDVRDLDAWVERDRKNQMQSARTVAAA